MKHLLSTSLILTFISTFGFAADPVSLGQKSFKKCTACHAIIDDNGEEISTSLMPEYVQLSDNTDDAQLEVAKEKEKWASMQAQMDQAVAQADTKRAQQ